MLYGILADLIVIVHLLFIVFVLFGAVLILRWRWILWIHLPAAIWGAAVEFFGWFCPLTPLENSLRRASGSAGYSESFIEYYIVPIIYPTEITRELQIFLGCILVGLNLTIYLTIWRRLHTQKLRDLA